MSARFPIRKKVYAAFTALLLSGAVPFAAIEQTAYSADLYNRSLSLSTSAPGSPASHTFTFNIVTAGVLGSIEFEYCSNDPFIGGPCTAPAGLSLSGASLGAQLGEIGFIIDPSSTVNKFILSRAPVPATPQPATYRFDNVINPSTLGQTVYVRLSTYASNNATGPRIDTGAVVLSTSGGLGTVVYVPPFLIFCVGITVSPNCSSSLGSNIDLGELSTTTPRVATSQFAGATNDPGGYSTSIIGITMTSGNKTIPALAVPSPSSPGNSQFGINLRANTVPVVGQNPAGVGTAAVSPNYNSPNLFMFQNGSQLISSSTTTDFNTFTVSYLVNIGAAQSPGVYNTTATFVATAAF